MTQQYIGKKVKVVGGGSFDLDRQIRGKEGMVIPPREGHVANPDFDRNNVFVRIDGVTEKFRGNGIFVPVANLQVLE